ncbi:MAG TPA: alginate lyase family protein [Candidatus Eisenbacteria bacterium]|nr:alginate lyase family protein [Candidatus Eisenbacteria bacterium]
MRLVRLLVCTAAFPLVLGVGVPPPEAFGAVWMTRNEIHALPMSGVAWNALKTKADSPASTPDLGNQLDDCDVIVLAKALVHVRTGVETYRTQVRQSCMAAIDTELGGESLALARNLTGYVIAAELVGLEPAEDQAFRAWLRRALGEVLVDGRSLRSTHEDRPNNYGTHAGASRAAVAVYLGDITELARTATVFRGWLGDRSAYSGFNYGDLSWQCHPSQPIGINSPGCVVSGVPLDGALPEEMRRGGSLQWPPAKGDAVNYTWEAIQGAVVQAEILSRQGYDVWNWQSQALRRMAYFLYDLDLRFGGWWASGDDAWSPWIINKAYGLKFPTETPTRPGKNMGFTDWTHYSSAGVTPSDVSPPTAVRDMSTTNP